MHLIWSLGHIFQVTGDATEEQLLLSVHVYRDKPCLLKRALNSLFNKFRYETVKAHCASLEVCIWLAESFTLSPLNKMMDSSNTAL